MNKTLLIVGIGVVGVIALVLILLPQILSWIGLHPAYDRAEYDLEGAGRSSLQPITTP